MAMKDCIEHLYSWDYTIEDAYGCQGCAERERIIKLLEPHRPTGKSVSGFLGVCSCGEAIDDYQEHLIALIKGEN